MHTTINDLPDELLAAIFEERESAERKDRDVVYPRWIWDQPVHTSYLRVPTRDKFNLTSVSRRWLSVASSTPRLWDEVYIDIDRDADTLSNALQQTLNRSKGLPLTVSIDNLTDCPYTRTEPKVYEVCSGRTREEISRSIENVFAALAPLSSRICSLAFAIAPTPSIYGFEGLRKWSSSLPTVQVVSFESTLPITRAEIEAGTYKNLLLSPTFLPCIHAPSTINITGFAHAIWILPDSLTFPFTKIQMNTPHPTAGVHNLLGFSKNCTNLKSVRVSSSSFSEANPRIYENLTFPSLREIYTGWLSGFIQPKREYQFPRFPHVTHLTVHDSLYPPPEGVHRTFAYNFPSLRELTVCNGVVNADHDPFLCSLPPRLQIVRLHGLVITGFVAYLAQQPAYLPELRVLWLDGCLGWGPLERKRMEELIEGRGLDVTM